jgi:uncharacterized hydrophobic protein (TIGR00271 family)
MSEFLISNIVKSIQNRFELHTDKAENDTIIESIRNGSEFTGTNLWVLILAIFIASVGLNVNSTAVIIGAMLISPLMGPIMGIGLGIGIFDFDLIKRAFLNLSIATVFSILTSAIYFLLSPLSEAQSELLARTTPTIWDVIIAFVGGLAGAIAITRKDKTNALPGVAIATALMPPLCTAGYGLANGNIYYFFGAFYLFFINSVFISLSTFIVIRLLHFPKITFVDASKEKKVKRYIFSFVFITVLPSIFLAYKIVNKSIFESKSNQFIKNEFNFQKTVILQKEINFDNKKIELIVGGDSLPKGEIIKLEKKLTNYNLENTQLIIRDSNANIESELNTMKNTILEEVLKKNTETLEQKEEKIMALQLELEEYRTIVLNTTEIYDELKAQCSECESLIIERGKKITNSEIQPVTVYIAIIYTKDSISKTEKKKITDWVKVRTKAQELEVVFR